MKTNLLPIEYEYDCICMNYIWIYNINIMYSSLSNFHDLDASPARNHAPCCSVDFLYRWGASEWGACCPKRRCCSACVDGVCQWRYQQIFDRKTYSDQYNSAYTYTNHTCIYIYMIHSIRIYHSTVYLGMLHLPRNSDKIVTRWSLISDLANSASETQMWFSLISDRSKLLDVHGLRKPR